MPERSRQRENLSQVTIAVDIQLGRKTAAGERPAKDDEHPAQQDKQRFLGEGQHSAHNHSAESAYLSQFVRSLPRTPTTETPVFPVFGVFFDRLAKLARFT